MEFGEITIKTSEYRPCWVDGEKALFHRWSDKETPIVKVNAVLTEKALRRIAQKIEEGIIPPASDVVLQKSTVAIIEYEDGRVAEVEPSKIRFVQGLVKEYSFKEIENDEN